LDDKKDTSLHRLENRTFRLHLISQFFNGISLGILLLQDIILKKYFGGSAFQIMLLSLLSSSAFLVSIYGAEIVNRSYNRSLTIIKMGIFGKISLMVVPFVDNPVLYILCIAVNVYLDSMLLSSWNIVFKHNYNERNRSKLFSYAATLSTIMLLITSTVFGHLLDFRQDLYRYFFPAAGFFGFLTYYNLSQMISLSVDDRIPAPENTASFSLRLFKDILILPIRNLLRILISNKNFLRFEIYFFLYGMAFMVILPSLPIFLVDDIKMSYSSISIAKGLIFNSTLIIFTPLMGRIHGPGNPARFCGYTFLILILYPLMLLGAKFIGISSFPLGGMYLVYLANFFFGIGMSGVSIAWALSSIYYSPVAEVSNYQAVHVTLTGVRGLFTPALGYAIMEIFSIELTFVVSAMLFLAGGILMLQESRKKHIEVKKLDL
jgi:hypothetical protein